MLLLLVPLALVLLAVSVLGLAGLGPLTDDRRSARDGLLGAVGPAVGLLAGLVLLALGVLGTFAMVGFEDGGSEERTGRGDAPRSVATTTTTVAPTTTTTVAPAERPRTTRGSAARPGPVVLIEPVDDGSFPTVDSVVDGLEPGTVLSVRAVGFDAFAAGSAEQCVPTESGATTCFNHIPVQFGEDGVAQFQYLISPPGREGALTARRCRADAARCTVVVHALDRTTRGEIQTIFGEDTTPTGRITVSSTTDLAVDGEPVIVTVRDYPPGVTVDAMLCAAPDATGSRCGAPGPSVPLVVGPDGRGRARLVVRSGDVGPAREPCGRSDVCGISVASRDVFVRAPVVPVTFAVPPGADYDPARLLLGLALAALLVAIGTWLVLRSDWSAIGEAAAPEIDDAEYADLDAIIAALPPIEDESVLVP